MRDSLSRRISTSRARPLPLARYCIGLVVLVALSFAPLLTDATAQPADDDHALNLLNSARTRAEVQPLTRHAGLDQLAGRYLDEILASRSLVPPGYGGPDARVLTEDVVAAIGEGGLSYRYTGVIVSYGPALANAVHVGAATEANGPALLEPALDFVGMASATIPAPSGTDEPWYAPPPGGVGLDIELTGMTVVVLVTAGDFRAST